MGIRIHKVVGYGITDLQTKKFQIDDSRFHGHLWDDLTEEVHGLDNEAKTTLVMENKDLIIDLFRKISLKDKKHAEMVFEFEILEPLRKKKNIWIPHYIWDPEFGFSNVMLFIPVNMKQWHRYDDTLDWIEDIAIHEQQNRLVELQRPPYPYESWVEKGKHLEPREKNKNARPLLPIGCLASLLFYKKAIKNIETLARELRPLLYVYWS